VEGKKLRRHHGGDEKIDAMAERLKWLRTASALAARGISPSVLAPPSGEPSRPPRPHTVIAVRGAPGSVPSRLVVPPRPLARAARGVTPPKPAAALWPDRDPWLVGGKLPAEEAAYRAQMRRTLSRAQFDIAMTARARSLLDLRARAARGEL
jgi:hypothetical protein